MYTHLYIHTRSCLLKRSAQRIIVVRCECYLRDKIFVKLLCIVHASICTGARMLTCTMQSNVRLIILEKNEKFTILIYDSSFLRIDLHQFYSNWSQLKAYIDIIKKNLDFLLWLQFLKYFNRKFIKMIIDIKLRISYLVLRRPLYIGKNVKT